MWSEDYKQQLNSHEIELNFCFNEMFPHPNDDIQHSYTYQESEFLETFAETKIMIRQWANTNLDKLNCENVEI